MEAELAAVFALSELECKSGGLIGKQEELLYVLRVGYPLWFVVRDNFMYVFDGLSSKAQHILGYDDFVKAEELNVEKFEVIFRIREEYTKFLVDFHKGFQLQKSKELTCSGLIADHELLEELSVYCREISEDSQLPGLLLSILRENKVTETVNQMEMLQLKTVEKIEKFGQLAKLISKAVESFFVGFDFELEAICEEVEAKIKAQQEVVNPKIEKLTVNYKKQVERLEKSIDKKSQPVEKQKSKILKAIKEAEVNIERYSRQVKVQSQKGNKRSENSLKSKIKKEKQKRDELERQQKKIKKQLEELAEQKATKLSRLKEELDMEIQVERQPIIYLETLRKKKQEFFKQERLNLEELTQPVIEEINQFIGEQKKFLSNMNLSRLKSNYKLKSNAIVYVPFYISAYSKTDHKEKRYFIFSPSAVGNLGFSSKLRGALGRAKIKDLFD
ncbi:MAG: hypothetical protein LBE76_06415, partial [Nitrososphaerota archaeon]|nr:hypothetical protein [Nitrososphaerota archaeon]